jgi:hypothetical protein
MTPTTTPAGSALSFTRYFAGLRDPRRVCRTTYGFLDLVFIALVATIAGANDPKAMAVFAYERRVWLQKYCRLPVDPQTQEILAPSHDTFERLLARLDPAAFARCLGRWTAALAEGLGLKQVAIDGKCLRGSGGGEGGRKALHLVQAWASENHLCLGQQACEEKSNEITAIPKLLDLLELKGALVTIDAMGCQKKIAAKVIERGGDYVLPVKGNQESKRLVKCIFKNAKRAGRMGKPNEESPHEQTARCEQRAVLASGHRGVAAERAVGHRLLPAAAIATAVLLPLAQAPRTPRPAAGCRL